jgi:hypothetical protein
MKSFLFFFGNTVYVLEMVSQICPFRKSIFLHSVFLCFLAQHGMPNRIWDSGIIKIPYYVFRGEPDSMKLNMFLEMVLWMLLLMIQEIFSLWICNSMHRTILCFLEQHMAWKIDIFQCHDKVWHSWYKFNYVYFLGPIWLYKADRQHFDMYVQVQALEKILCTPDTQCHIS